MIKRVHIAASRMTPDIPRRLANQLETYGVLPSLRWWDSGSPSLLPHLSAVDGAGAVILIPELAPKHAMVEVGYAVGRGVPVVQIGVVDVGPDLIKGACMICTCGNWWRLRTDTIDVARQVVFALQELSQPG